MSNQVAAVANADERLASLRAAVQAGLDDVATGRVEEVDDPVAWVQAIADTVTVAPVR